jgi:hypothetical protein
LPDGGIIISRFKEGIPVGFCALTLADGNRSLGELKKGVQDGYGILWSAEGKIYLGQFNHGKNGKGKLILPSGDSYDGDFVDNK